MGSFSLKNGGLVAGTFPAKKIIMSRLSLSPEESTRRPVSETKPASEKVGALTFHLYLKNGCPEGSETDFWKRAREMVADKATPTTDIEASMG